MAAQPGRPPARAAREQRRHVRRRWRLARLPAPARLDDRLEVTSRVAELGRASLALEQQAWLLEGDERVQLLCEGRIRIGWVDAARMKPARIPNAILQLLTP